MSEDEGRERYERLKRIVLEAQGLPEGERAAHVERACGGDDALRQDVEELLAAASGTATFDDDAARLRAEAASGSAWDALIAQLRSRGPGYERYVFEAEVARGGMGVIHRVFDQDARRTLALKVMLGQGDVEAKGQKPPVDDASLGRFVEEAQVTSQLDHPGIVPVHEIGVDGGGRVYFTMKLVKGEDLRAVFDRVADPGDEEWTTTRALNVLLRVCEAMAYAHEKGVVHRDLKPGNVMVGKFGEAYVMDWGLARVMGKDDPRDLRLSPDASSSLRTDRKEAADRTPDSPILTMDGAVVGTPAYMPPEQAKGRVEEVGPPADVYAVGAMLYHLLAGRMPYTEPGDRISPRTILALVTQGPPAPLAVLAPDAPAELIAIVERSMAREIGDRYPDMIALARDLRAFLENRVVAAYETGAWAELKKWVQRNRALATTAAAAVVAVLALAGWALLERQTARENEQTALTNEAEAERQRDRADDEKEAAEAERDRVLRLSDKRRLDVLLTDADALWPAHPENVDGLKEWLGRAKALLQNHPLHEANLAEVRARGTPLDLGPPSAELTTIGLELAKLRVHLALHEGDDPDDEFDDPSERAAHVAPLLKSATELEEALAALQGADLLRRERARDHLFGDDVDARWWHDAVRDLVVGLRALEEEDVHGPTVAGIEERLAWAETVADRTTTGTDVAARWAEARAAIKAHPNYGELDLAPQIGIVPLGPDPESTLWEFGHPRTGHVPVRDPDTGKLAITMESGLVFVLVPGGTYRMGTQDSDEDAPHFDPQGPPLHEVRLDPYFLSKYEMTQGQWTRSRGENPSYWMAQDSRRTSLAHPVEMVSWEMCDETLRHLGLSLPTAAQWEAACRGGSGTTWSFGDDVTSFPQHGNVKDATYARSFSGAATEQGSCESFDDGHATPATVGTYQANGFGLHDMHGNVWEWCRDAFPTTLVYDKIEPREGDGVREVPPGVFHDRVFRGGSFHDRALVARSAFRSSYNRQSRSHTHGVRPVRTIDP